MEKKVLGKIGEDKACDFYKKLGYKIVDRNFVIRGGEIDFIAGKLRELIFVEVKTRISDRFGLPEESVGFAKEKALQRSINAYLSLSDYDGYSWQVDLIAINIAEDGKVIRLERFENILS